MNSEQYLEKFRNPSLQARLFNMADEYTGPCGQGATSQTAAQLKRKALLEAANLISELKALLERLA